MKSIVNSVLKQITGPKKTTHSASFGVLREHLIVVSKSAFEAAFYRPTRLIRALNSSSELSSADASASRRFSAQ
jgi:hypothetical protein